MDIVLGFGAGVLVSVLVGGAALFLRARSRPVDPVVADDSAVLLTSLADVTDLVLTLAAGSGDLTDGERLTVVDELRARDLIDAEQHATARERVLGEEEA